MRLETFEKKWKGNLLTGSSGNDQPLGFENESSNLA